MADLLGVRRLGRATRMEDERPRESVAARRCVTGWPGRRPSLLCSAPTGSESLSGGLQGLHAAWPGAREGRDPPSRNSAPCDRLRTANQSFWDPAPARFWRVSLQPPAAGRVLFLHAAAFLPSGPRRRRPADGPRRGGARHGARGPSRSRARLQAPERGRARGAPGPRGGGRAPGLRRVLPPEEALWPGLLPCARAPEPR
jgi:hypothetical protein